MAKDPRFNFYVDNWIGGTEGFTLEQEGAYLSLVLMQTKIGRFTKEQAFDKLMQKTRGNTAVCTALLDFLIPKFDTDGVIFWSARLEAEVTKSKSHSIKQTERINKRWNKDGNTAVLPVNRSGNGIRNRTERKEGVGENQNSELDDTFKLAFDEITMERYVMRFKELKIPEELEDFKLKVKNNPGEYLGRDSGGLRTAFQYQLAGSKNKLILKRQVRRDEAVDLLAVDFTKPL